MEEDLETRIEKASWKLEEFLNETRELLNKVHSFPPEKRSELPKFSGPWKEKNVKEYLERLKEAIERPRIMRSRKLLEEIGVSSMEISKDILENVEEIEEIVETFSRLRKDFGKYLDVLIEEGILITWLKEGGYKAKEKLQSIVDAKAGFIEILNSENLNNVLKKEFLKKAFKDFKFIEEVGELNSQIGYIREHNIIVEYRGGEMDKFLEKCRTVYQVLKNFEEKYKLPIDDIKRWVEGKSLDEVCSSLEEKKKEVSNEYDKLKRRWRELAEILGEEILEPEGFSDLREEIERLERKCKESLGEPGLKLLDFFKGKADFPDDLSKEELKEAMKKLRPFIRISFRKET
mgnify:CR=1 FL=1